MNEFENGIGNLNPKQLQNLIEEWSATRDSLRIFDKLRFYEIGPAYFELILEFLQGFTQFNLPVHVENLDTSFEGLQVTTRDSFHKLITDGFTGVWVVNPSNVSPLRIQIASMNDYGPHPRGWYIQADIVSFEKVIWEGQIRYRIYFKNPETIDSGRRNVKFRQQPVQYIKRKSK